MDPVDEIQRHRRLKRLFLEARAVVPGERAAWMTSTCGDDEALRRDLEELLEADVGPGPLSDESVGESSAADNLRALIDGALHSDPAVSAEAGAATIPSRIGPFRPREILGRGGMAVVYLATQDAPRRDVALKVLRGDVTDEAATRIEREAEVLGRLEHPGIARVFSAGRADTPWGEQGYIAMELVNGRPLLQYAREEALTLRARLELVAEIADALQAAHAAGVVHRDLKPSNVLVQRDGSPKLLDFGVARFGPHERGESAHTRTGQIVGTLATMSPEQAAGAPGVDARADVYALGAVLYQLCADRLPIDTRDLPLHEAVRRIQHDDPAPLGSIRSELRGDVETIANKALEKEPARRYRNAGELAADLRRHLEDLPIAARRQQLPDHVRRFVRRHKPLVAGVGVAFLALAGALVVSLYLLDRARDENRRAGRVREAALRLTDLRRLEQLERSAQDLWPADESRLPELEAWMAEAELLAAKLDWHRELLTKLDQRLDSPGGRERIAQQDTLVAKINDELWMREAQAVLVDGLEDFVATGGTLERVAARRAFAESLRAQTVIAAAAKWEAARAAVSSSQGPYAGAWPAGTELRPRAGLLPLGEHSRTRLQAFALAVPGEDDGAGLPQDSRPSPAQARFGSESAIFPLLPPSEGAPAVFVSAAPVDLELWSAFEGATDERALGATDSSASRTFVSRREAADFAARLGGRLPTHDEWLRALAAGVVAPDCELREWISGDEATGLASLRHARGVEEVPPLLRSADVGFRIVLELEP